MPGSELILHSADSQAIEREAGTDVEPDPFPVEYLRSLDVSGPPPGELHV